VSLSDKYIKIIEEAKSKYSIGAFGDSSFPDAAFIVERGAEKDDSGKTLQKFRHLPHHNKNVTDPNDNSSVDIPHLRNALARASQVKPIKEAKSGYVSRATTHLRRHAKTLLKTSKTNAELKEIQDLCNEFEIPFDNKSEAAIKVVKNGDAEMPYCVMSNGKKVKCYNRMKDAQDHINKIMKG